MACNLRRRRRAFGRLMKVLLTSGYTGQALAGKEGLPAGLSSRPKPTAAKSWRATSGWS